MWELTDIFNSRERKFSVLEMIVHSLDRLWTTDPDSVKKRLQLISRHTMQSAPDDNHIHETLAHTHLFHFLRTGDSECEAFITRLIDECDSHRASHALARQLHVCRAGGWLTAGDSANVNTFAETARTRTWWFVSKLLSVAQERLRKHREKWRQLHENGPPDAESVKPTKESIDRTTQLVDGIAMQIYFASGAFAEKQSKEETCLNNAQLKRFWKEAKPLFEALSAEPHPQIAHHVVQTLHHLLPCAPREVFLAATKSICTSASAGFQHDSLAVGDVVKLIQRALADHRDILQIVGSHESDCLESLLKVLDLFVEAGWAEARQLTHRLEEIYR